MKIDIDAEVAAEVMVNVLVEDYNNLLVSDWYDGDKEALLVAYRAVMKYSMTEDQIEQAGLHLL